MIVPDPTFRPFPCNQLSYQCRVLVGSLSLAWLLLSNDTTSLEFDGSDMNGTTYTYNSSDGQFTGVVDKIDPIPGTNRYLITSTLRVRPLLDSLNGSVLICRGGTLGNPVQKKITITLSGE